MISYQVMDASRPLPTCLHGGPIPLAQCQSSTETPAYIETVTDLPTGFVARGLHAISEQYGACGMMAIHDELVVGKLRFYPQAIIDQVRYPCVQQERTVRALLELNLADLPSKTLHPVLHLYCFQVAEEYKGRGICRGLLDATIAWARSAGWQELRANAVRQIPPLLNWCGQTGCEALQRRGFVISEERSSPELREGVVAQRQGAHGEDVRRQWDEYANLSDDEAAVVYTMTCKLVPSGV